MSSKMNYPTPGENMALAGRVIDVSQAKVDPGKRRMMEMGLMVANMARVPLHVVAWPDGSLALVPANPDDRDEWRNALLEIHRHIAAGAIGPVYFGGAQ